MNSIGESSIRNGRNNFRQIYKNCVPMKEQRGTAESEQRLVLAHLFKGENVNYRGIPLIHLGTLFSLDFEKRGYFDVNDFIEFDNLLESIPKEIKKHPNVIEMEENYFSWIMYCEICDEQFGEEGFAEWIVNLMKNDKKPIKLPGCGDELFIHGTSIKRLYEVLEIENSLGYELQEFSDILYESGVEQGLYSEEALKYNSFIGVDIIYEFGKSFGRGFCDGLWTCGICGLENMKGGGREEGEEGEGDREKMEGDRVEEFSEDRRIEENEEKRLEQKIMIGGIGERMGNRYSKEEEDDDDNDDGIFAPGQLSREP